MKKLLLLSAVVLATALPVRADRIELLTGQVFTGTLLRLTEGEVSIRLDSGGLMSFRLSGVRTVTKTIEDEGSILLYGKDKEDPDASLGPNGTILTSPKPPASRGSDRATLHVVSLGPDASRAPEPEVSLGRGGEPVVTVPKHHFAVTPPRGFVAWPEGTTGGAVFAYRDPETQSTFLATVRVTRDDLERVKKAALRTYAEQFPTFHVVRDEALEPGDDAAAPEAWRLEIETRIDGTPIRQTQVFRKRGPEVVILSCSSPAHREKALRERFDESLRSFRFTLDRVPSAPRSQTVLDLACPPSPLDAPAYP